MNILQFCEICFRRADQVGTLLISSCRHMFCRRCSPTDRTSCAVCSREARIIDLCEETMPDQLKDYFNLDDQLTKSYRIMQFQNEKMDKFIAGKIHVLAKYEEKKRAIRKLKEHADSLKKAILEEKDEIRKLRERRYQASAPPLNVSVAQRVAVLERNMQNLAMKRPRSTSCGSSHDSYSNASGSKRMLVTPGLPDDVFKVPTFSPSLGRATKLVAPSTRERIYQQQARNMGKATSLPAEEKPGRARSMYLS